jgi:diguanylate cyclase (GGDEF)-like protein
VTSRRLFLSVTSAVVAVIAVLLAASLLGVGGAAFEDTIHNVAELAAGLFAGAMAVTTALRSRGRRRLSWWCWAAFGLSEAFSEWNALAAHHANSLLPVSDLWFLAQDALGLVAALLFMRAVFSRLTVIISFCDGLLMGSGLLMVWLATRYDHIVAGSNSLFVNVINLAQPITDVVILTLVATVIARVGARARPVGVLIGAAIIGISVADSQLTHQVGLAITVPGSIYANGWIVGLLSLGLAALYAACFRRHPDPIVVNTATSRTGLWVPILPVALACTVAVALRSEGGTISDVLLWLLLAILGLTLTRMYLTLYLNVGLGKALAHQAAHDSLTGLPNRLLLKRKLERELAAIDSARQYVTLLMLDLDGFKEVNDTLGHSTGDQVLVHVARRVVTSVRDVDSVARLGGDEFAVVMARGPTGQAITLARRMLAALELPITVRTTTVAVGGSIGIATGGIGDTADELLRNADLAMYAAKAAGGNGYALYKPQMHTAVAERVRVESGLRTAWLTGDLIVHYQPIVDLANGRMVSVEALARWKHPDGDVIPPSVFIPIAEQTGMIIPIGARVLNEACLQLASWQLEYGLAADITMSVNVSPRQLYSDDFTAIVAEALRTSGIEPRYLILEVTETAVMDDMDSAIRILSRLKALGVGMAIDDFGVGASSLARLRRLPVDIVKIDKSLVDHVPDGHVASGLLAAVVGMVRALQLRTIIEGVERADQAAHLRGAGYDLAQGYFYAKPMPPDAVALALGIAREADDGRAVFPDATAAAPPAKRDSPERVLVVDDDEGVGVTACRILERHGLRAVLVGTIREAMAELSERTDLMIVDIGMPDGDGWELISHVRSSRAHRHLPVVVMTGLLDSAQVLNRAYDLECEYLGKPFAPEALMAKLDSARMLAGVSRDQVPA